ncbi:MAG: DMT family transporter [Thermoproteota archaeon]|nr:DMT family transporter [Thermoproteota archaeon]
MNIKSGVVFANAFVLSIETILVESLTAVLQISPLTVAASSIPLAGGMLLFIVALIIKDKITVFKSWRHLLPGSASMALGIITWYDSVSKIGASKEATLTGPLEATVVLFLAWFFLKERLSKIHLIGALIAILGIFAAAMSERSSSEAFSSSLSLFTVGDLEAILSALAFAIAIIFLAKLVKFHSAIQVAGGSLFVSGLILAAIQVGYYFANPTVQEWEFLFHYSFLPLIGALLYSMSLRQVGASITSIIASSAYLMTIVIQLMLSALGFKTILPENIPLLVVGGLLGLLGISLIHKDTITVSFRRLSPEFHQGIVRGERRDE